MPLRFPVRRCGLVLAAATVTAGLTPSPVAAERRFAQTTSARTAGDCPRTAPCRLDHAAEGAAPGDEVIVLPGEHRLGAPLDVAGGGIDVHGADGQARPRIVGTHTETVVTLDGATNAPLRLRHLEIVQKADHGFVLQTIDGSVELSGLVVSGEGQGVHALELAGSTGEIVVRDTVARVGGDGGAAIVARAASVQLRNVTAIAPQQSQGLRVRGDCLPGVLSQCSPESHAGETTARNVIARGGVGDVVVMGDFGQPGTLRLSHSNAAAIRQAEGGTYVDEGANQTAAPRFADAAAGDYHQAPGSPTIDAGTGDRLGSADLDGEARTLGPAPDIGADERPPDLPATRPGGDTTGGGGDGAPGGAPGGGEPGGEPSGPGAAPEGPSAEADRTRPVIGTPAVVRRGRRVRVRLRVSEAATVTVTVEAGRRCGARRRRCARYVALGGRLRRELGAGTASLRLDRRLAPGSYRVVVRAVDASGNAAKVRRVAFRVPRR